MRDSLFGTANELSFLNTAASWDLGQEFFGLIDGLSSGFFISGLGEGVYGLVIAFVILLGLSGLMANTLGPSVEGGSPRAVSFNGDVVDATTDFEETCFSPVVTPGVTDGPIFVAIFINAISHY